MHDASERQDVFQNMLPCICYFWSLASSTLGLGVITYYTLTKHTSKLNSGSSTQYILLHICL